MSWTHCSPWKSASKTGRPKLCSQCSVLITITCCVYFTAIHTINVLQWVMSIVPVAKKNGMHHSGGDYKVTISAALDSRQAILTQSNKDREIILGAVTPLASSPYWSSFCCGGLHYSWKWKQSMDRWMDEWCVCVCRCVCTVRVCVCLCECYTNALCTAKLMYYWHTYAVSSASSSSWGSSTNSSFHSKFLQCSVPLVENCQAVWLPPPN